MSCKVPRWIHTTLKQIEWYQEQIDYLENTPLNKLGDNKKDITAKIKKCHREIDLLTKEIANEHINIKPNI